MADDKIIFDGSSQALERVLDNINAAFDRNGDKIIKWTKLMQTATETGDHFVVTGITAGLDQITTRAKVTDGEVKILSQTFIDGAAAMEKAAEKADRLAQRTEALARKKAEASANTGTFASKLESLSDRLASGAFYYNIAAGAVTKIGTAFKDSAIEAIEFERILARIETLPGAMQGDKLSSKLFGAANKYGFSVEETAGAYKGALQTGPGGPTAAGALTDAAGKLAQATGTDLQATTAALTASLNAYGLSANDAGRATELLHQAWQKGVPLSDGLSNAIGRLGLQAKPLGISMEEMIATLEAFRQKGVSTTNAVQMAGFFMAKLSAPTEELKIKFHEAGAETAQQLIAMKGWSSALETIFGDTTDTSEVMEAFKNTLGGTNKNAIAMADIFKDVARNIDDLKHGMNSLDEASKHVNEDFGEEAHLSWKQFKNDVEEATLAVEKFLVKGPPRYETPEETEYYLRESGIIGDRTQSAREWGAVSWAKDKQIIPGHDEAPLTTKNMDDIIDAQVKKSADSFDQVRAQLLRWNDEQIAGEKLITDNLKHELDTRVKRYEDAVKLETEVASRARELARASDGRTETSRDNFDDGRRRRQLALLTPAQRAQLELDALNNRGGQSSGPRATGFQNPYTAQLSSLQEDRDKLFEHATDKNGQAFLDSKDIDRGLNKNKEINKILEERYSMVAAFAQQGKATEQDVLNAERAITEEKSKQDAIEAKLHAALKQKEADAKALADAEKIRLDRVKTAADEAINLNYINSKGDKFAGGSDALLKRFDELAATARTGTMGVGEHLQVDDILRKKRKELEDQISRQEEIKMTGQAIAGGKEMADKLKTMTEEAGKPYLETALNTVKSFYGQLSDQIKDFLNGKTATSSTKAPDAYALLKGQDGPATTRARASLANKTEEEAADILRRARAEDAMQAYSASLAPNTRGRVIDARSEHHSEETHKWETNVYAPTRSMQPKSRTYADTGVWTDEDGSIQSEKKKRSGSIKLQSQEAPTAEAPLAPFPTTINININGGGGKPFINMADISQELQTEARRGTFKMVTESGETVGW